MTSYNESTVEAAALGWLVGLGWQTTHVPYIAPDHRSAMIGLSPFRR